MNESSKHAVWILGLVGSITLAQWNIITGIACGAAGFVAACLSIISWFEKRRRRAAENQKLEDRRLKLEEGKRRHHHLSLVCVLLGLALQASAQTYGTTGRMISGFMGRRTPMRWGTGMAIRCGICWADGARLDHARELAARDAGVSLDPRRGRRGATRLATPL